MTEPKPINEILPDPSGRRPSTQRLPDEPALSERDLLVLELVEVGIALRKAESLADHYPYERIRRQLEWLPLRGARRPASLLIAAIEHDYDAPAYAE